MEERITRRTALRAGAATAGLLAVGGLAACGSGDETAATTAAGKTQNATIKYWTHDKVLSVPLLQHWTKTLNAEPRPPYRYTLDATIVPVDQLPNKARTAFLAHSNAPDMLNIEIGAFSQIMPVAKDTLVDLTDAVDAVRSQNLDNLWKPYSADGRVYGVELSTSWSALYYRADEFKALGLPTTFETWDDFLAAGQSKAVPKGKALGMVATAAPLNAASFFVPYLLQAGGQVFNPDGSVALKSQEAVDALDFVSKAVQTGVFQALENTFAGPGAVAIKSSRVIATPCAEWYNKFVLQPTAPEQKGKWREGPLPAFTAGGPQTSYFGGSCFSVAKDSPVADASVALLKAAILTQQAQIEKYTLLGFQPTWKSVYDDPAYLDKRDPFMGGQKLGELFASLSKNAPSALVQSPNYFAAMTILTDEVVAAYKGQKSAQTAIADASAAIEAKVKG